MDNNFENEFYGFEPQKPITEKESSNPPENVPDMYSFNPQKPLMQNESAAQQPQQMPPQPQPPMPPQQPAHPRDDQGFNPIQHTAVYSDNRFVGAQPVQMPPQPQSQYRRDMYPPQQPYYPPVYLTGTQSPETKEKEAKKNKVNTALVVIVVVLGIALLASLLGMYSFLVMNAKDKENKNSGNNSFFSQDIPEITIPDNGGNSPIDNVPSTTEPAKTHDESDYSDKTDKDFKGLNLLDKPSDAETNKEYGAEYAFNSASDSVVSVLCFEDEIGDNTKSTTEGSGIIISSDGFIVTNSHLINNSKTAYAIKVVTSDGKEYTAGVVGFDSRTDLAVLKLKDAKGLKAATFGDSDKLELGEDIIIIGNPGGIEYQNSMTKGIVSAINRDASSKNIVKYIQTDAAINPGNSGGPAVNNFGQVIGVASAKIASEQYEGMGFCIPSAQVKTIVDKLIKNGYVDGRVKIGITGVAITATQSEVYNLPRGIVVYTIDKGGPCDNTDLKAEDIITKLDGTKITSFADIYSELEEHKAGDKVKLGFYRQSDGKDYEIEITLQEDKK